MKPPYENNRVYAVAKSPREGLKAGYTAAVFAEQHHNQRVSPEMAKGGQFFLADPDEFRDHGGNADRWDPTIPDGFLVAVPEDEDPLTVNPSHVLSAWSDRDEAWAAFESRRAAGRRGAATRVDRQAEEKAAEEAARVEARRKAREESPLGRIQQTAKSIVSAFVVQAQHGNSEYVMVQMRVTPDRFRKMMAARGVDADLVEEFLADDDPLSGLGL